ncbi:hypothetical protein AB205_0133140 [Aquarana catesbeiana]|uniref:Secreted protein n=1 Tax=Aquarana catesbeiana TaxID=8400 RepID=A0A2G9RQN3_AQUCT|nr:hypothetical protein AB205_0133140 [Aquarana catesbeiana]
MLTFFMAFLFNWIGFFLSFCLTTSAAGRYGAISGFGLSLIKWILIVRDSFCFSEDSSITQRFESCQTTFPLSQEPGFFLFIKVDLHGAACILFFSGPSSLPLAPPSYEGPHSKQLAMGAPEPRHSFLCPFRHGAAIQPRPLSLLIGQLTLTAVGTNDTAAVFQLIRRRVPDG